VKYLFISMPYSLPGREIDIPAMNERMEGFGGLSDNGVLAVFVLGGC
jgi:hypothetical protein